MKYFLVVLSILFCTTSYAGQRAITDTGEEVILNSDMTWRYVDTQKIQNAEISVNPQKFTKSAGATFLLKSKKTDSAYWVDSGKWQFFAARNNPEAEYEFQLKGEDLYGMTITESIRIPVETLADIAVDNARGAAPDIQVVKKEYRNVNGVKALYMEMRGTLQGMAITYFGYYFSNDTGSTQLITYTGTSLTPKYRPEIESFLNGFALQ